MVAMFAGCIDKGPEGKYVSEEDSSLYIEIKKGGIFILADGDVGTWEQEGNEICFTVYGEENCCMLTGDTLSCDGEKLIKTIGITDHSETYNENPVGKYMGDEYGDYIEIKEDGTFVVFVESQYFTGTWEQEGPKIWLIVDGEEPYLMLLVENMFIDPEEQDRWIKEEAVPEQKQEQVKRVRGITLIRDIMDNPTKYHNKQVVIDGSTRGTANTGYGPNGNKPGGDIEDRTGHMMATFERKAPWEFNKVKVVGIVRYDDECSKHAHPGEGLICIEVTSWEYTD